MGFKLHREDQESLIKIGLVAAFVAVLFVSLWLHKSMPAYILGIVIILWQQIFVIPSLSKGYHTILEAEDNWKRFIPIWNEVRIYPPVIAIVVLVFAIPMGLLLMISFLSYLFPETLTSIGSFVLGSVKGRVLSFYTLLWALILVIPLSIAQGAGYFAVKQRVDSIYLTQFKYTVKLAEHIQYILLFFPFARLYSLFFIESRVRKMCAVENLQSFKSEEYIVKGRAL